MRLETLLNHAIFNNHVVMAGKDGLSREVVSVNIMDAPDIAHFLKPVELLLTNGYFMKRRPELILELMDHLISINCPGIAIKTKRFSLEIPQAVLDMANAIHFPIIEISDVEHSLGEILQQSTSLILGNKNVELQYALAMHKKFSSMIMNGEGTTRILESLSQLLSAPVVLIGQDGRVLDGTEPFKQHGMPVTKNRFLSTLQALPAFQTAVSLSLIDPELAEYRHIEVQPVVTFRYEGYIAILRSHQTESALYALAVEQAANVIGMEIVKKQAVKERSRRYKNEYFANLIEGFFASEQEAIYLGKKYGLRTEALFLVVVVSIDDETGNEAHALDEKQLSEKDDYYDLIKRQFVTLPYQLTMFTRNGVFGLLFSMDESAWEEASFIDALESISEELQSKAQIAVSVGVGNPTAGALNIGLSFGEALRTLQTGYQIGKKGFVLTYKSDDIGHVLRQIPYEELAYFYKETFRNFELLADGERADLYETLRTYYDNQCQLLETARQLFIHRNTVTYRLEKCERLIGANLKEPRVSLRYRVAFAAKAFLKK